MESELKQVSGSVFALIGPEGATNFTVIKNRAGRAILIDADIRRIDEIEEALELAGCSRVEYLIDTHEHFDHTSANFYFARRGIPIVASSGCVRAMREQGGPDFERMMKPENPSAPSGKVEFHDCFVRGKGDLVALNGCRLLNRAWLVEGQPSEQLGS